MEEGKEGERRGEREEEREGERKKGERRKEDRQLTRLMTQEKCRNTKDSIPFLKLGALSRVYSSR